MSQPASKTEHPTPHPAADPRLPAANHLVGGLLVVLLGVGVYLIGVHIEDAEASSTWMGIGGVVGFGGAVGACSGLHRLVSHLDRWARSTR